MTVTVDLLDVDGTVVIEGITQLRERGWSHLRAAVGLGKGSITVPNSHPSWDELTPYRRLRWNLDGQPTGFFSVIERRGYRRVGRSGQLLTVLDGRGGLAALGTGTSTRDVPGAVVVGYRNSGALVYGLPAPDYDDSTWTPSVGGSLHSETPEFPDGFPDPSAQRVYPEAPDTVDGALVHDAPATWWGREKVNLGTDRRIKFFVWADNRAETWFDGEQALSPFNNLKGYKSFEVDAVGESTLAFELYNSPAGDTPENTASVKWTAIELDSEGQLGAVVARSTGGNGVWVSGTPATVTAGYVISRAMQAAHDRGALPNWTTSVTDTHDSFGNPWTVFLPLAEFSDQDSYWQLLESVLQKFNVDADAVVDDGDPAEFELVMWEDRGSDNGIVLDAGVDTDSALSADVDHAGPGGNAVRVAVGEAYAWVNDDDRIAAEGLLETAATFGNAKSVDEAQSAIDTMQGHDLREPIRQTIEWSGPSGKRPYTNLHLADTVGAVVKSGTSAVDHVLQAISCIVFDGEGEGQDPVVLFDLDVERRL